MQIHPQWTAKMYPPKPGRDHLGLGSVSSDQILPSLSPAINVLTFHPRYHSFYVFLLDEFWRRDHPRSSGAWIDFFRPREFIFSVGVYFCDQAEHGQMSIVVGGQKTGPLAGRRFALYDTSTEYIESELGGYGLYYRTVMAALGLIYPGGTGYPYPVDVPSEKGKALAARFRRAVEQTTYYQQFFDHDTGLVPIEDIQDYARRACLCQLQVPSAPDRPMVLDAFLHGGMVEEAAARRATLQLFLDLAVQADGYALDELTFRQLLYFQSTDGGATYTPSDAVLGTYKRWRLYQAREYYGFALNAMWCYLCDWGVLEGGDLRPIALAQLWEHARQGLNFGALAARFGLPAPTIDADSDVQELLNWLRQLVRAEANSFDRACILQAPLNEDSLYRSAQANRQAPEIMIAGMVTLLAIVYLRFSDPDLWLQPEWAISRMGADGRLSVDGFIRTLDRRVRAGRVTIEELTRWLFRDYVILQHQLVATSKLPDNTFRFQREGDHLRFFQHENALDFMNSRFDAISTTVHELGLCGDLRSLNHALSQDGRRLLEEGDVA
jgi:hypothetical protein